MSKVIKLTPQYIEECTQEFKNSLISGKFSDGKISYNKVLDSVHNKAKLIFTEVAWLKMQTLVKEFNKEVAWHGVAHRGEDETKAEYYVTDILVYPQKTSGAYVDMDVEGYDKWIRDNYEDERFFNIAMQGHSHVNMPTNPSGTDLSHQETILEQLTDDMFYIFVIWNKSDSRNIRIYDLAKNVLFETADVDVEVQNLADFIKEAKNMVKDRVTNTTTTSTTTFGKGYTYTPPSTSTSKDKKENPPAQTGVKPGKRKGKKKKNKGTYNNACDNSQLSLLGYDDMDINDPFYYREY